MKRPLVLGHRGAPLAAPENTLASFRAAIAQGADGVELDVRLCRTGELVVCHDATLGRLAGADVRVAATSLLALRRYDLGAGERVPTLDEVFAALPPAAYVNVEIKADGGAPDALARATAASVARARAAGRVVVSSFEPAVLRAMRAAAPSLARGLLVPPDAREAGDVLSRSRGVGAVAVHPHHSLCAPERVAAWRARGLAVNVWTVDMPEDVARVARAGVSAVISNFPGDALALLRAEGYEERGQPG